MKRWSNIRHRLENEYLAESLRGRIRYFAASYRKSHDREGRASVLLEGVEILSSSYYDKISAVYREYALKKSQENNKDLSELWLKSFTDAENKGFFDQKVFYEAFNIFDNQSIEESMKSEHLIVRIFAVLDRRTGKRTLIKLLNETSDDDLIFLMFLHIRAEAEGININ